MKTQIRQDLKKGNHILFTTKKLCSKRKGAISVTLRCWCDETGVVCSNFHVKSKHNKYFDNLNDAIEYYDAL